jgi:hypothetical protein
VNHGKSPLVISSITQPNAHTSDSCESRSGGGRQSSGANQRVVPITNMDTSKIMIVREFQLPCTIEPFFVL